MKAIGFDLGDTLSCNDGVPMSWETLYPAALRSVADACGCMADGNTIAKGQAILREYNTRLSPSPRKHEVSCDEIMGRILAAWDLPPEHLSKANEAFFHFFRRNMKPFPDALPALRALKNRGFQIGILTDVAYGMSRCFVEEDLVIMGMAPFVDVLLTSVDVQWRKPEPHGCLRLAQELGVAPDKMLYVGNEEKDIVAATRAGMGSVLVVRDGEIPRWGQTFTVRSLDESEQLI